MNEIQLKISTMIENYKKNSYFYGKATDREICEIENILQKPLEIGYKWYISTYGSGGLDGINILGVAENRAFMMIDATSEYKKYGLENNLLVIEELGEYVYCIDFSRMKNGECPIVSWSINDDDGIIDVYENFYEFIIDRFNSTIENL